MLDDIACGSALLLQGPNGPFFRRLGAELQQAGARVTKVNFNAGDALFYPGADTVAYRGTPLQWRSFLRSLIEERHIDQVFLFGDGRPYHRVAIELATELGVSVQVFEEGYLRPDFITLERGGVNGHSSMPRDPQAFRGASERYPQPRLLRVGKSFGLAAWQSIFYALACTLGWFAYPHYEHHRRINAWYQAYCWVRGGARKVWHGLSERGLLRRLQGSWSGRFFFFPLQVHCDYQLSHSPFSSMEQGMEHVLRSFAEHAPQDARLVLKHHPMDRPYRHYGRWIRRLSSELGIAHRVLYIHDLHLPAVLKHARGTVVINSTVGMQSLHHGTPVKVLGKAIYDMPGLTHQDDLRSMWRAPQAVDAGLFCDLRAWLLRHNQANGNFHRRLAGTSNPTGVRWFPSASSRRPVPACEGAKVTAGRAGLRHSVLAALLACSVLGAGSARAQETAGQWEISDPQAPALAEPELKHPLRAIRDDLFLGTAFFTGWGLAFWEWFQGPFKFQNEHGFSSRSKTGGADKTGHLIGTYIHTEVLAWRLKSMGYSNEDAALWSSVASMAMWTWIEIGDGTSARFGASVEDLAADFVGAAMSYFRTRYPKFGRAVDLRWQYFPSEGWRSNRSDRDVAGDYSGMRHLLALRLSGLPWVRDTPLRFVELHTGYYTRGFRTFDTQAQQADPRRVIYFGVGLDIAELLEPHTWSWVSRIFNYYQVPIASYEVAARSYGEGR